MDRRLQDVGEGATILGKVVGVVKSIGRAADVRGGGAVAIQSESIRPVSLGEGRRAADRGPGFATVRTTTCRLSTLPVKVQVPVVP